MGGGSWGRRRGLSKDLGTYDIFVMPCDTSQVL